ncbi:hypothetical protein [Pandoraea fibrosis]|uniref:Uncharacterized protein n=1 Tax=Pandoraea fibrosis TaxID=1891094 RepID=A0A5E4ST06_9BURK|nr:hypothetical protein [Pandoraea fibrosis]VVD77983.1 hypothetical protein PFI31113_00957 [Pandoraea fibrosis]
MNPAQKKPGRTGLACVAGVWCDSPEFHAWLSELARQPVTKADAIEFVYLACGIESRAELDTDKLAAQRFIETIRRPYRQWLARRAVGPNNANSK